MYSPNLTTLMKMLQQEQQLKETRSTTNNVVTSVTLSATPISLQADSLPFSLFPNKEGASTKKLKKKVLLVSDHCQSYNYNSKVSWNLIKVLAKREELEVYHFGINQNENNTADHRHYPANVTYFSAKELLTESTASTASPSSLLNSYVDKVKPDYIVVFQHVDTLQSYLEGLGECQHKVYKMLVYADLQYYNVPITTVDVLNKYADRVFVNTDFYKRLLLESSLAKPVEVLRYGFDRTLMPIVDKKVARYKINLPESGFTILAPCENTKENRYDIVIKAYAKLISKYPEVEMRLFCLCDKTEADGYPIIQMYKEEIKRNGCLFENHTGKIMLVQNKQVFNDEVKNVIFNSVDVGICCPETANAQLNALDMMFVGVPQIIVGGGAYAEYVDSTNSAPVPIHSYSYSANNTENSHLSEIRAVNYEDVFLALERYLRNPSLIMEHGEAAKRKVSESADWATNFSSIINSFV